MTAALYRDVKTVVRRMSERQTAIRNLQKAYEYSATIDDRAAKADASIEESAAAVNIRKYDVLANMYDIDKFHAMRRIIRVALICVLFTTVPIYLGLMGHIHPSMTILLCCSWWIVFACIVAYLGKKHNIRDRLFWNRYFWADPPQGGQ